MLMRAPAHGTRGLRPVKAENRATSPKPAIAATSSTITKARMLSEGFSRRSRLASVLVERAKISEISRFSCLQMIVPMM
jgi:hypothetical protein